MKMLCNKCLYQKTCHPNILDAYNFHKKCFKYKNKFFMKILFFVKMRED